MTQAASAAGAFPRLRRRGALPGFKLTLGFTLVYLLVIVVAPLSALLFKTGQAGASAIVEALFSPRTLAALKLSFGGAAAAAGFDVLAGFLVAWVLARYDFPARGIVDAIVDLPFALPTAVAGIALTALYGPEGWIGRHLTARGIDVAFAPAGVVLAMAFVGMPFVVRTVQPVLAELDPHVEEAAAVLGAGRLQTFLRVILPAAAPALLAGFGLAFARALGEYGSIVFISGNMPMRTEIAPLLIVTKLEQYDYAGAAALAAVMLAVSATLLLVLNVLQARVRGGKREGR